MSVKQFGWVLLLPLLLSVASCTQKQKTQKPAFALDTLYLQDTVALVQGQTEPYLALDLEYIYPNQHPAVVGQLNKLLFNDSVSSSATDAIRLYLQALAGEHAADVAINGEDMAVELLNTAIEWRTDVLYQDDSLFTIELYKRTSPSGAAHPYTNHSFFNLTLPGGHYLTESDLFEDTYKSELPKILLDQLRIDYESQLAQEGEEGQPEFYSFFEVDAVVPNGNFSIEPEGLSYCFNEYDIAPYYYGTVYVFVPYERLLPLLKKDSPLKRIFPAK